MNGMNGMKIQGMRRPAGLRLFFCKALAAAFAVALSTSSIGHAGFLDDVRGAIDTVRDATDTVNDAKDATQDAKDLMPEVPETEKAKPTAKSQPPPLPQATQWHVSIGGESAGPFPASRIESLIAEGRITRESLVWKEGMNNWVRADSVAEISTLFGSSPPPLPSQ